MYVGNVSVTGSKLITGSFAFLHYIRNISYWVSCFTLIIEGHWQRNTENVWEPLGRSMFVYSSCSPKNVSCGCPPTVVSTSPWTHHLTVSLMMFFSQFPLLFWDTNKSILQDWLQSKFRKRRGDGGRGGRGRKKRCGGVQFLDALQIIKVSCFSPRHSPLSLLQHTETRSPLVIHREEIHPDANRQTYVWVWVWGKRRHNKAGYHSDHTLITSRVSVLV